MMKILFFCAVLSVSLIASPPFASANHSMIQIQESNWKADQSTLVQMSLNQVVNSDVWLAVETRSPGNGTPDEVQYRPATQDEIQSQGERAYRLILNAEGGVVFQSKNIISVPGGGEGSRINLADVNSGPFASYRLYLWWMINQKHSIRMLYAPLSVSIPFTPSENLLFDQVNFLAGRSVDAFYKFNSYRISYIYHFDPVGKFLFRAGFTAKIRDAAIQIDGTSSGQGLGGTSNIGFAPLLNVGVRYQMSESVYFDFDADALAASVGRAIDASLRAGYQATDNLGVELGYRVFEGGADVKRGYNFAWFNYAFVGITGRF